MNGRLRVVAAGLAVALTLALGACGDDDGESGVPEGAVAVVGDSEISQAELEGAVAGVRRAQSRPSGAADKLPDDAGTRAQNERQLRSQALSLLLQAEALEQEAAERGVDVDIADARARWRSLAREQFPTRRALRRFLGGQREADVVKQLRLQMLFEEIQQRIADEAGGGKKASQAIRRFQREFRARWQRETECRDDLDAVGCPANASD